MKTRVLPLPSPLALILLVTATQMVFSGCACSPSKSASSSNPGSTPPGSAATAQSNPGNDPPEVLPSSPAAALGAVVAPANEYTAEIAEVSETASGGNYQATVFFNNAEGNRFEVLVEDSASGQLLAKESVDQIDSAAYSHSVSFAHRGSLASVVVRIIDQKSGQEVDRWSPR